MCEAPASEAARIRIPLGQAYLNVDTGVSGKTFRAMGTPSLGRVLSSALGAVADPSMPGRSLADSWDDGDLYALGSGSDYTAFIDHLGIPSLDMAFWPGAAYGVYHSVFDSFEWMDSVGDPGFKYHVAMAQVWGLVALRLAGTGTMPAALRAAGSSAPSSSAIPFNLTLQAEAIGTYISEAKARPNGTRVDFAALDAAHAKFESAARQAMREEEQALAVAAKAARKARVVAASVPNEGGAAASEGADGREERSRLAAVVTSLNERLAYTERRFLSPLGLPGRKYFQHVLQAPGLYTGYAPKTLPGVYDAVSAGDWATANAQAAVAAQRIEAAAVFLGGGSEPSV